jgi:hypothetical protein
MDDLHFLITGFYWSDGISINLESVLLLFRQCFDYLITVGYFRCFNDNHLKFAGIHNYSTEPYIFNFVPQAHILGIAAVEQEGQSAWSRQTAQTCFCTVRKEKSSVSCSLLKQQDGVLVVSYVTILKVELKIMSAIL